MFLAIAVCVLVGSLDYFLLMPLELNIDSSRGQYCLRMGFLARVSVEKDPVELLRLHLKVLFLNFFWRPSDLASGGRAKKKLAKKAKRGGKRKITMAQGRRLLQSFRIKAFRLELDTGDPILNAQLYPLFFLIGQYGGNLGINFTGHNSLTLQVVNRPIHIIKAIVNLKK